MLARSPATSSARFRPPIERIGVDGDRAIELRGNHLAVVRVLSVDQPRHDRDRARREGELIRCWGRARSTSTQLGAPRLRDASPRPRDGTMNLRSARRAAAQRRLPLREPVAVGRDHRQRIAVDLDQRAHQDRAARLFARRSEDRRTDAIAETLRVERERRDLSAPTAAADTRRAAAHGNRSSSVRT